MTMRTEPITVQLASMAMRNRWLRIAAASWIWGNHSKWRDRENTPHIAAATHGLIHCFGNDNGTHRENHREG